MNLRPLLILLSLFFCIPVHADRLLIWGVQDGCTHIPELDKALDRQFYGAGIQTWVLAPKPSSCQGAACAQRIDAQCGGATGRILGGQVQRGKSITRVRLWLHDLSTHQTAHADEFCQDCNLTNLVQQQAQRLWEKPSFGAAPGPIPLYCQSRTAAPSAPHSGTNKLYLTVYGDSKGKSAIAAGLKEVLAETARPIQVVRGESKQYGPEDLARIVGPNKDGQVLGVDLLKDGGANIWLYDGPAGDVFQQPTPLDCTGCDAKAHVELIKNNLAPLLAHCFGTQCSQDAAAAPPAEACEPFAELTCGETAPAVAKPTRLGVDPKVARILKGGMWGLFAAEVAAGAAIFAISPVYTEPDPYLVKKPLYNTLNPAGWALAGTAALTLAIAIPSTIILNRAERASEKSDATGKSSVSAELKCPQ